MSLKFFSILISSQDVAAIKVIAVITHHHNTSL